MIKMKKTALKMSIPNVAQEHCWHFDGLYLIINCIDLVYVYFTMTF